jgi:hypothetical protein
MIKKTRIMIAVFALQSLLSIMIAVFALQSLLSMPISAVTQSFSANQLNNEGKKAYDTLVVAKRFEGVAIGIDGHDSELVKAYRELLKQPLADEAFKSLLKKATLPGQLYALCGVYYTDHSFFLTVIEEYKNRGDYVEVMFGCLGGRMPVSEIVESKAPNVFRPSSPKQLISKWLRKILAVTEEGYLLDIVGGGYPSTFK